MTQQLTDSQPQPLSQLDTLLQEIATLTGLPQNSLKSQLQELDFPTYEYDGKLLVPPNVADPLIDQWAAQIKSKLYNGAPAPQATPAEESGADTEEVEETWPAETQTAEPIESLKLPKDYAQQISNRYATALDKVLPADSTERQHYLEAIAQETEAGQEYLARLAKAIEKKYKGRTGRDKAYQRLLETAQEML